MEYGLLVALIAVVIAAAVYGIGVALKDKYSVANHCANAEPGNVEAAKCKNQNPN